MLVSVHNLLWVLRPLLEHTPLDLGVIRKMCLVIVRDILRRHPFNFLQVVDKELSNLGPAHPGPAGLDGGSLSQGELRVALEERGNPLVGWYLGSLWRKDF